MSGDGDIRQSEQDGDHNRCSDAGGERNDEPGDSELVLLDSSSGDMVFALNQTARKVPSPYVTEPYVAR